MPSTTIAEQVEHFNEGFNEQVGPRLASVFSLEQKALNERGVPASVVAVGDHLVNEQLVAADGSATTLYDSLGAGEAVVVFYRGAWCPYCNLALKHYQAELLPALRERGIQLVAISPQTPEGSAQAIANGGLDFPVVADPANNLIRSLGLITEPSADARSAHTELGFNVADSNADATGDIPFPTVLVVSADRVVRFADVHVDYTTRTEVADILGALDA